MSCLHAWEAKIEAEKKRRRPPSRSQNRNLAASVKCSHPRRRNKASSFALPPTRNGIGRAVFVSPETPTSKMLLRCKWRNPARARRTSATCPSEHATATSRIRNAEQNLTPEAVDPQFVRHYA